MPIKRLNIAHIVVNEHGQIFDELIELLSYQLQRLGMETFRSTNCMTPDMVNLVIGHTGFLTAAQFDELSAGGQPYITFQVEALGTVEGHAGTNDKYLQFLRASRQVWDYSQGNVVWLSTGSQRAHHIPIGYAPILERIKFAQPPEFDVVFFGSMSPRRKHLLAELAARKLRVAFVFNKYAAERDQFIGRSTVVLNVHQHPTWPLEQVRLSYLLNNRCFVISEEGECNPYGDGVLYCDYEDLAECCQSYCDEEMGGERESIATAGYQALKAIPMLQRMREAILEL